MKNPLVSIIVIAKNEEKNIEKCLKSLILQNYTTFEIVVVIDMNSNDRTESIVKKLAYKNSKKIRIIKGGTNRAIARNIGINVAKGEIIAFIDADAIPHKAWLKELVKPLIKNNKWICSYGKIISDKPSIWPFRISPAGHKMVTCNLAFKKNKVNIQFDELLPAGEDAAFVLELKKIGKIIYCPTAIVKHPVRLLSIKKVILHAWDRKKYEPYLFKKYGKEIQDWFGFPFKPIIGPFSISGTMVLSSLFLIPLLLIYWKTTQLIFFLLGIFLIVFLAFIVNGYKFLVYPPGMCIPVADRIRAFINGILYVYATAFARIWGSIKWRKILL